MKIYSIVLPSSFGITSIYTFHKYGNASWEYNYSIINYSMYPQKQSFLLTMPAFCISQNVTTAIFQIVNTRHCSITMRLHSCSLLLHVVASNGASIFSQFNIHIQKIHVI